MRFQTNAYMGRHRNGFYVSARKGDVEASVLGLAIMGGDVSMEKVILSIVLVWAIIYLVPFLVYGLGSAVAGLQTPAGVSTRQFLVSVFVSKIDTALAFVLIFYFARGALAGQWVLYAFVWWLMFIIGEIGQAIGPNYGWKEAVAGVMSETIYLPLSAWLVDWLLGAQ